MTRKKGWTMKNGVIFPGCGVAYLGNEKDTLLGHSKDLEELYLKAKQVVDIDEALFNTNGNGMPQDELQSQYLTYLYSCATADLLKKKNLETACCAGYSMGVYAALYHAGSISFEDGLRILNHQYRLMQKAAGDERFSIGAIIGLAPGAVEKMIFTQFNTVELINVNNKLSTVVAGPKVDVSEILAFAKSEGALKTMLLPVSLPYHTRFMVEATRQYKCILNRYLADADHVAKTDPEQIAIKKPKMMIISAINQKDLTTPEEIVDLLTSNLSMNINWMKTMESMLALGVSEFVECGPGKSLSIMSRFIQGDFRVYNFSNLAGLFRG